MEDNKWKIIDSKESDNQVNTSEDASGAGEGTQEPTGEQPVVTPETTPALPNSDQWNSYIKERSEGAYDSYESMAKAIEKLTPKDDYIRGVNDYYNRNGNLTEFFEVTNTNWDTMPAETIARMELKAKYPNVSDENFELLYKKEVVEKYGLGDDVDEDIARMGQAHLEADTSNIRAKRKQEQEEWKQKQAPPVDPAQELEQWTQMVDKSNEQFMQDKRVVFEIEGGEPFNYEVKNVEAIRDLSINNQKFFGLFSDGDKVNWALWNKVMAYATDPEGFEKSLVGHGINLGKGAIVDDLSNQSPEKPVNGKPPTSGPKTLMEAWGERFKKR